MLCFLCEAKESRARACMPSSYTGHTKDFPTRNNVHSIYGRFSFQIRIHKDRICAYGRREARWRTAGEVEARGLDVNFLSTEPLTHLTYGVATRRTSISISSTIFISSLLQRNKQQTDTGESSRRLSAHLQQGICSLYGTSAPCMPPNAASITYSPILVSSILLHYRAMNKRLLGTVTSSFKAYGPFFPSSGAARLTSSKNDLYTLPPQLYKVFQNTVGM